MNEQQISNIRRRSFVFPPTSVRRRQFRIMHQNTRHYCTKRVFKSFVSFFFSKSPPRLKAPLSWHCIVGHRDTNIRRRTDSIQQVEPIAFEHWKVKRQIVATVDWPHAKWNGSYVRTDTNATDLWEIEQSTLWNSAFQRIPQLFGFGNGFKVATAKHRWYVA